MSSLPKDSVLSESSVEESSIGEGARVALKVRAAIAIAWRATCSRRSSTPQARSSARLALASLAFHFSVRRFSFSSSSAASYPVYPLRRLALNLTLG